MCAFITWLDSFIHHFDTTAAHKAEVVVCMASTCATSPAELILAKGASHVVAAFILLYPSAAHRTEGDVSLVLFCPAFELLVHCLLT